MSNEQQPLSLSSTTSGRTSPSPAPSVSLAEMTKSAPVLDSKTVFSKKEKQFIVGCVSLAGFFSPLAINIYIPALAQVAQSLHVSIASATLTVTIFMIFQGLSPALWAPLADVYGRRPVYVATFIVFIIGCLGLGKANTLATMLVLRALQASGSSSVTSIGSGTIGDISLPHERGSFMGWYSFGQYLGPCVGPVVGGVVAQRLGYHYIFWILAIFAAVFTVFTIVFMPETLPSIMANGSPPRRYLTLYQLWKLRQKNKASATDPNSPVPEKSQWKAPNLAEVDFLGPYKYLAEWDILLICVMFAVNYGAYYAMSASQSDLFGRIYGLDELKIGLTFIPSGVGCALGAVIGGKIVDRHYAYYFKMISQQDTQNQNSEKGPKSKDTLSLEFPIESARLLAIPYYLVLYVASLLVYGWVVEKKVNLAVPLVMQFIIGYCSTSMFGNLNTLLVDLYPLKPASAVATNNLTRCWFGAILTAVVTYVLDGVGAGWTFVIFGGMCLVVCFPAMWAVKKWGANQRAKRAAKGIAKR